jgi:hypothetical protein
MLADQKGQSYGTPKGPYPPIVEIRRRLLLADTVEKLLNAVTTNFLGIFLGTRRAI